MLAWMEHLCKYPWNHFTGRARNAADECGTLWDVLSCGARFLSSGSALNTLQRYVPYYITIYSTYRLWQLHMCISRVSTNTYVHTYRHTGDFAPFLQTYIPCRGYVIEGMMQRRRRAGAVRDRKKKRKEKKGSSDRIPRHLRGQQAW